MSPNAALPHASAVPTPHRGLTISDVARRYRVKRGKVLNWILRGELRAINVAEALCGTPRWVVTPDDVAEFERRRTSAPIKRPPPRKRQQDEEDFYPD
jgi:hypothetical protein